MRVLCLLAGWLATNAICGTCTSAEPPQEAFFQMEPVRSATYATYTVERSANTRSHVCAIYRLEIFRKSDKLKIEDAIYDGVPHFLYRRATLNVVSSSNYLTGGSWVYSAGGEMPVLCEMVQRGHPVGGWGPRWPKQHPVLVFPVFEISGMNLRRGQAWESPAMPFVLQDSIGNGIIKGEILPRDLPPTTIRSRWTGWETVNGYACAVIDFSFEAQAIKDRAIGQEGGEYRLSGKSYFCVDLGLPVVNEMKASGFVVSERGTKTDLGLERREVLICVEPVAKAKKNGEN